jgi:hypothetical protein
MVLSLSGKAALINYVFRLEGSPSESVMNGLVITGLNSDMSGGLNVQILVEYYSPDYHYRHLFNVGGLVAVLHNDTIWVGNTNGDSTNCVKGWQISAAWPVNTPSTLILTVLPTGQIGTLTIDGVVPPIAPSSGNTVPVSVNCQPLHSVAGTPLFFGASGNENFNDNFAGSMYAVGFGP